jgi:phospholipase/carboxylesterase
MPNQVDLLARLLPLMDTLGTVARNLAPQRLAALAALLDGRDTAVRALLKPIGMTADPVREQLDLTATLALQACYGLRAAVQAGHPMQEAYRAMRQYSRAQEALHPLADSVPAVSRYLLDPAMRDDPVLLARLKNPPHPSSGVFHAGNQTSERGGYSVYVPSWYDGKRPMPVAMALHGGSGHGRLFLWNWIADARSRGLIVIAPTAAGSTWSLEDPEIDTANLIAILKRVRARWTIDPGRMLLTGMSDGGTFTLLSGLSDACPFTHLAPVAASFHPMLLTFTSPRRLTGLPIRLTHGALDWMFPVDMARTAHGLLAAAGAAVVYDEVADLSHAWPRDRQGAILDWFMPAGRPGSRPS